MWNLVKDSPVDYSINDVAFYSCVFWWRGLLSNLYIQQYPHKYFEPNKYLDLIFPSFRRAIFIFICDFWFCFGGKFSTLLFVSLPFNFLPRVNFGDWFFWCMLSFLAIRYQKACTSTDAVKGCFDCWVLLRVPCVFCLVGDYVTALEIDGLLYRSHLLDFKFWINSSF